MSLTSPVEEDLPVAVAVAAMPAAVAAVAEMPAAVAAVAEMPAAVAAVAEMPAAAAIPRWWNQNRRRHQ
jgi:hypothetical protein